MKIRTRSGFWGAVATALFFASWAALPALGDEHHRNIGLFFTILSFSLLIFMWPAIKYFVAALRAVNRDRGAARRVGPGLISARTMQPEEVQVPAGHFATT